MHAKSKLIEKQISDHSYDELFRYFDFHLSKTRECHELLKTQVSGGYSLGHSRLTTLKTSADKCWFITSGMIIGIKEHPEKEKVMLLFCPGEMAILPETFFNNAAPSLTLIACPETHFIEIDRDTIYALQRLVSDPMRVNNKLACASYKNFMERFDLMDMEGIDAIREFHARYPQVKGPDKKIFLKDSHQADYLGITDNTFCRLKKRLAEER